MIDGTYNIKIDVPFGRKSGTVVLRSEGEAAFADIDAPVIGKQHVEGHVQGNTFTAEGSGHIKLVGDINYTLSGEVSGNDLHIHIESNKGEFELEGTRA